MIDCKELKGRKRHICQGHDDEGNPVNIPAKKRRKYLERWSGNSDSDSIPKPKPGFIGMGDRVHNALSKIGITPARVSRWLGRPCGCKERVEKLNSLHAWVRKSTTQTVEKSKKFLLRIIGENEEQSNE
jgi:hypothetical protein